MMASGTLRFDGVDDGAETEAFLSPDKFTIFWDMNWSGAVDGNAGIIHVNNLYLFNTADGGTLQCRVKMGGSFAGVSAKNVGISTAGKYYSKSGTAADFKGTIGEETHPGKLYIGRNTPGTSFAQMDFRQLLIFNKELSQAEVNDVLRVMFPA